MMAQKAQRVAELLAADVLAGRLAPGDPVPSVRELARLVLPWLPRGVRATVGAGGRTAVLTRDSDTLVRTPPTRPATSSAGPGNGRNWPAIKRARASPAINPRRRYS
jgi:hypothetical protein